MASGGRGRGAGGARGGAMGLFQGNGLVYTEEVDDDAQEGEVVFELPSESERSAAQKQLALLRRQADSPYWTRQPPLRADERELPRYTDRYHPDRLATATPASLLEHAPLQKDIFPPNLLASFTSTEAKRVRHAPRSRRPAQIDWDNLHAEERRTVRDTIALTQGDGEEEEAPESDEEDLGDYEDEEEDDYAQNYFDNGEDDDEGDHDDGGGDEAAFD
ncbi:hypothetical protein MOBT1_000868 [Malassezia obtusa]|uniref:DNA-directed RNA polymerase III subunit n=1 Tax=Malassezia obtusa TaxID=76774 RepID=A0AAF0E257_9BASI|nr:hypothetical protein MOBT1_000868 [Malassezia obtusa]